MRYTCTIYTHDYTFGGGRGVGTPEPSFEAPTARVEVTGQSVREAAARAYVQCVGRERARLMRQEQHAPRKVIAQETSCKAIAASLRKTARRIGECYELDNFVVAWFIKVEPTANLRPNSPRPRRTRLPLPLLHHLSSRPSPN
jgi:hypothetical protein